ncbi:MAG: protein translocase subunit SecD [Candidatus Pacebacteria bacterium]|nr:protein translocase subunit SecD [Candidatus Paceibacterota bacterium]
MSNKQIVISFIAIIVLAVLAGLFCYPAPINQLVDKTNSQFHSQIPQFPTADFKLGLDLKGGVHLEYKADLSKISEADKKTTMEGLRDLLERRINAFGVGEPIIQIYGTDRVAVELPGFEDIDQAIAYIGQTPLLEFWEEKTQAEIDQINAKKTEINDAIKNNEGKSQEEINAAVEKITDWQTAFESPYKATELTGRYLTKAVLNFDQNTGAPIVELQFNEEGAKVFEDVTGRNVGKSIAILLDGQSIIDTDGDGQITSADMYAPRVDEKISGGKAVITGIKETNEANTIVQRLNQGALPVPLGNPIVQEKVGPTLGAISLENAVKAGMWSIILIAIFLIFIYRFPGLLASGALLIYVAILFSLIKMIPVTLTLAGIGGLILSIGIAVDANILIFSRMREELKSGKDLVSSIEQGMVRAWPSIRDGHFATVIVALILYFLGTSFIKGFAFALIIGILLSLFSAIVITHIFLLIFVKSGIGKIKWLWS